MKYSRGAVGCSSFAALALIAWLCASTASPLIADSAAFRPQKLAEIDAAINQAIAEKSCPGGVLWLEHCGVNYHKAYGNRALLPAIEPATEETIFDAASLTKVVACAPAIMLLIERGKVKLDEP